MNSHQVERQYDRAARLLHWVSALFFIAALAIGLYFSTLDYRNDKTDYAAFLKVIYWHKTFGVLVFLLVFYRLYHRWKNPPPGLPADSPAWMRAASWLSHLSLYGLIIVLGVSGLVASDIGNYPVRMFAVWPIPQFPAENRELADEIFKVHMWLGNLAAVLVAIHVVASFYHHLIVKDDILTRMLPGKRGSGET
jgi:cytochrome b561